MYCPKCGRRSDNADTSVCPVCSFAPDPVAELVATSDIKVSWRGETHPVGKRMGVKLMFFSIVSLPLIVLLSYLLDSPLPFSIPSLVFFAGLAETAYGAIFGVKRGVDGMQDVAREPVHYDSKAYLNLLVTRLNKELKNGDAVSPLIIEGLMLELVAETSRNRSGWESARPKWLAKVENTLRESYTDPLNFAEIAGSVGVHPTHLARVFRQFHQCTMGDLVRNLRIEHSCRQLASTEKPLSEIALSAGFYDQSHFSRCFKQILGLTPSEYRSAHTLR